jgi:hypothetical protein
MHVSCRIFKLLSAILILTLAGCPADAPLPSDKIIDGWEIVIQQQTIRRDWEGLPMDWTFELSASNPNSSPYEGEFAGYAVIRSFCDVHPPGEPGKTEYGGEMTAHQVRFTLNVSNVAPLTERDASLDPAIADVGTAAFVANYSGPMLLSTHFIYHDPDGIIEHINRPTLEVTLNSHITQIYDRIFLSIEPFQWDADYKLPFEGRIDLREITIAPLTP